MKRYLILIVSIVALFVLGSCSGLHRSGNTESVLIEAHPGSVLSFVSSSDSVILGMVGYPLNVQEETLPEVLKMHRETDDDVSVEKTIECDGKKYVADYVYSRKLSYRNSWYDYYRCEKDDQTEFLYAFCLNRETDRVIGYDKIVIGTLPSDDTQLSDQELTEKATEELAKFTDVNYYKEKRIESLLIGSIETEQKIVWFYNKLEDVEFADSSCVRLTKGGIVLEVKAFPEPETINACKFNELNVGEFDAAVEEQLKKDYPDYHRDDETRLLDVKYTGMKVQHRCITSDDDGKPVIAYYVTPQMEYDLTWKDEAAKIMTDKGEEVHKEGVSEPPVYLIVYIE
jgi:hypothetical protein